MTTRVAIYTRVSSEEQIDGYSLAAQYEIASKFAESKGWQLVKVYEERGRSGKTTIRPEFQQMMNDASLRLFDVVLVHKLDRFSRSLLDVLLSIKQLHERNIVLVSASESMMDFSTPQGKLMAVMMAAFAEWYLDNLRDEITKGKRERARQGDWNGTLSYGYTTTKRLEAQLHQLGQSYKAGGVAQDEYERLSRLYEDALDTYRGKHDTAAIPHPVDAHAITLAFTSYKTGAYSDANIADLLNQHGYRISARKAMRPFGKDTITDLLQNRFYTGVVQYKGEWAAGAHHALISQELFDECQVVRSRRSKKHNISPRNAKRVYPLSGLLQCLNCGTEWYGQVLHGTAVYRDPARQKKKVCSEEIKSAHADELEGMIANWLCDFQFPDDLRQRLLSKADKPKSEIADLQTKKLKQQLENLLTLFKLGDIDQTEYLRDRAALKAQISALAPITDEITVRDLEKTAETILNLRPVWNKATLQERKLLLQRLLKTVYIRHGEIVAVEPTPVLWHLIRGAGRKGIQPALRILAFPPSTPRRAVLNLIA